MAIYTPPARPQQSREETARILAARGVVAPVAILGVRGYYKRTAGDPTRNDRGIYDDALFVVTPSTYATFNANTDPSADYRPGLACLRPGLWWYKVGTHGLSRPPAQRYTALVQAGPVTVDRDGEGPDTGWFGINIHRGATRSTSSLGCQTIPPSQWPEFIELVRTAAGKREIPYLLVDGAK